MLWSIGVIIFLLLIITGFLGYSIFFSSLKWLNLFLFNTSNSFIFSCLVPMMIYRNAETDKSQILSDTKGKTGIYMWTNIQSGKIYIGSAFDLSKRFSQYFSIKYLKGSNNYICNALIHHSYSAFSLSILEYIDISNLSKEKARELVLSREQYFLDLLFSVELGLKTYNILQIAGSSLGYRHTDESLVKMSGENHSRPMLGRTGENNPNFGKTLSEKTRALISEALSGVNHPMFGNSHTPETKALLSEAFSGENHPMFGKTHSVETTTKMSVAKGGGTIYVYDTEDTLAHTFSSARKAALHFGCSHVTITNYVKNGKLFRGKWILSVSLITKEE
jgi:group I intron endonuclease